MISKWGIQIVYVMIGTKDPLQKSMDLEVSLIQIVELSLKVMEEEHKRVDRTRYTYGISFISIWYHENQDALMVEG